MFLYRDEVYEPESQSLGIAEVIIGRHRYGATGMIILGSLKLKFGKFSNLGTYHRRSKDDDY
jgi:replicative DNA helicase